MDLVEGVQDGRFYALKRILCHDREGRQEAQTEVEMHRLFSHPNILGLAGHTFIERGGKSEAWILLPYVQVRVRVCACLCNHACMCVLEPGHFFGVPILFFWGRVKSYRYICRYTVLQRGNEKVCMYASLYSRLGVGAPTEGQSVVSAREAEGQGQLHAREMHPEGPTGHLFWTEGHA